MKYTNSIEIALPQAQVAQLLADPAKVAHWLRDIVFHEALNGPYGQVGSTSRVVFQSGKRQMECTETITRRDPADVTAIPAGAVVHFDREITAPGMTSVVRDRLTALTPESTRWESDSEFHFTTLPMRAMALLLPRMFRNQSQQHLEDFKAFAEHGTDVRDRTR
ncbi:SRPBCC family protein [Kribbella sandramycini]|uniref:SRPBCC family protein n=1 Tax=Kribbella sandramycini TaxID=60450 RepID=A0A7Y4KXI9_9ACTN|nr:SRPBCC family protein [Kribbella sandramycini]MBB6569720.1 hypothetical protein [Kribbella sandramycini]NOL40450.1 SRPBCC family protein [Kribbella sandramycini]